MTHELPAGTRPVAVVTGAGRGLGREISRQLAGRGMTVLATTRDADRGRAAVAELLADGGDVRFARLDVTNADDVREVADLVQRELGRVDLLINNAGVSGVASGHRRGVDEVDVAELRATLDVNLVGVFAVTTALLPMLRRSGGRVVNLTSALGTFGRVCADIPPLRADLIPYCTSKAALNMVTVLWAGLLRGSGVRVYAVSPGYVATGMNNFAGTKTVEEGAAVVVRLATAEAGALPERAFLTESGAISW